MLKCPAEGRIGDAHLAPPQAQDLPDDGADVVHIHLLYDPTRLHLSFKSIAQSIKFFSRFGDQQRQLRQKCQLVSTHLLTPVNLPENGEFGVGEANVLLHATNHSPTITDLRSEPPQAQPSRDICTRRPRPWVNRDLPFPIPGEGRGPVAQSLPNWRRRLSHRLEGPNRLRGLAP